jgi:hypothetical protein
VDPAQLEEHRHRAEVRQVLAWRVQHGLEWVRAWLDGVQQKRGADAAARLRSDCREQWQHGNRGAHGDWR